MVASRSLVAVSYTHLDVYKRQMQRGEYQSKICPYGYRKSADGKMEPDPEAAAVVQLIFQLAAEGINATAITRELFRRSIPTPGQYKAAHGNHTHDISRCHGIWSASTILRILEDEQMCIRDRSWEII